MTGDNNPENTARPASVADLKLLLGALQANGVDYLLIGGYALYALGYLSLIHISEPTRPY